MIFMLFYRISEDDYVKAIKEEINKVVVLQEELDIDVLVHGEPEVISLPNYLKLIQCFMAIFCYGKEGLNNFIVICQWLDDAEK